MTEYKPPKTPHGRFMALTLQRYRAMTVRFAERKDKRDRVYRYAKQIPFTLEGYRSWCMEQLGGSEEGTCRCAYCGCPLDIVTMVTEHRTPPNRGGSLAFDNLCTSCDACNQKKGGALADSWLFLKKCLDQLPESCRRDFERRLQMAVKMAAGSRWRNSQRFKNKQPAVTEPNEQATAQP
jgi:5-methylcytosine-specific restriction endonuclease McrA